MAGRAGFRRRLEWFWRLSRKTLANEDEARSLDANAYLLGDGLARVLAEEERRRLIDAAVADVPPLLVIESADDLILALPWELLRLDGRFAVRDGRLDVARCVPAGDAAPVLEPPKEPVTLLINVSAPHGSRLNYEEESYLVTRALQEHVGIVVNEMGEIDDLVAGLGREPQPIGVHFSGHGGPGTLVFEDAYGDGDETAVDELITRIRKKAPRLPRFFYLACCHGGDPAPTLAGDGGGAVEQGGVTSTASELHREGITQVVAYFGPVYDRLSTWAETAFYREIAAGKRTRDAVRAAREELTRPLTDDAREVMRDAAAERAARLGALSYGWAQLALYHRGPDYPLGAPLPQRDVHAAETTQRDIGEAFPGSRTQVLRAGFVGRRKEMHALRRDLKEGRQNIHVVQGLGGLGKSAFCNEALKLYRSRGWLPLALWCADVEQEAEPVSGLLRQFEMLAESLFGEAWSSLVAKLDRAAMVNMALQRPAARLTAMLSTVVDGTEQPFALYLDNLESLLIGPAGDDPAAIGEWRDNEARVLWRGFAALAENRPGRFALLASCRYRHADFRRVILSFERLPNDALWRLMGWFPTLRRLSVASRSKLVERLAGHPRSVEFLDRLLADAVADWEDENERLEDAAAAARRARTERGWAEREWREIVEPTLTGLAARLSEDLLFEALWRRVLDPAARDLLVRATVLRIPAERELLRALHGGDPVAANAVINRLRDVSLLTELGERRPDGGVERRFEVHPGVARLALALTENVDELRREAHRQAGSFLEEQAQTSPSWQDNIEAAYHLGAVGEADRAFKVLAPYVVWLQNRGRYFDSFAALESVRSRDKLAPSMQARFSLLQGEAWSGLGVLGKAIDL